LSEIVDGAAASDLPNHPLAVRMGVIAALSFNILIGSIFGTAGVLLRPMQERLHVTAEMSSAGVPLVMVGSAVLASVAGVLAGRYSLRVLMAASAVVSACAWLILAFSTSYVLYIVAYGLLLGPAMALAGAVLPPTLVTRWFHRNRGLAIGLVHLPIMVAILPVATNWVIEHYGLQTAFLMLAGLSGLVLLPAALLVIDHPPGETAREASQIPPVGVAGGGLSVPQLLRNRYFWALAVAVGAINTSSVLLGVHLVSMGESWGFSRDNAALLTSVMSLVGVVGSVLFGAIADRLGGTRTLALIVFDAGVLWLTFLAGLPFIGVMIVVGLIGMHGSGAIPSLSRALADALGQESFSRAYGLASTVTLPLMVLGVLGTGTVYRLNGNYAVAVLAMVAYFALAIPLALYGGRSGRRELSPA
jgi:cyanate permease